MKKRKIAKWEYVEAYIELQKLKAENDAAFNELRGAYNCSVSPKTLHQLIFHYWIEEAGRLREHLENEKTK